MSEKPMCQYKPTWNGLPCPRHASYKLVHMVTEEPTYVCGLHFNYKTRRTHVRFKIDENGRAIRPSV